LGFGLDDLRIDSVVLGSARTTVNCSWLSGVETNPRAFLNLDLILDLNL